MPHYSEIVSPVSAETHTRRFTTSTCDLCSLAIAISGVQGPRAGSPAWKSRAKRERMRRDSEVRWGPLARSGKRPRRRAPCSAGQLSSEPLLDAGNCALRATDGTHRQSDEEEDAIRLDREHHRLARDVDSHALLSRSSLMRSPDRLSGAGRSDAAAS